MLREVLTSLARHDQTGDAAAAQRMRALSELEWGSLLQLAALHRVLPNLTQVATSVQRLPPATAALLRSIRHSHRSASRVRQRAYAAVLDGLAGAGVRAIALKGFVLATECYPAPELRSYFDLDVLVRPEELPNAASGLRALGFEQKEVQSRTGLLIPISEERKQGYQDELQHLAEFTRRDEETGQVMSVDLHFRLSTVFDHMAPAVEPMISDSREYAAGRWTLAPADFVTHLCYHAWWDTQSVDNVRKLEDLRLAHFADIRLAMEKWRLSCGDIVARASVLGVEPCAHWGLMTTSRLFGGLEGDAALDRDVAGDIGAAIADRWVQRGTHEPFSRWSTPSWERIFDMSRGEEVAAMFLEDYVRGRTRRGDVMTWRPREPRAR